MRRSPPRIRIKLAEANFKGYGHHPLLAACDNTGEPLAWMLRRGSAGANTAAGHIAVLEEAVAALPPAARRRLMVTCDGAGASHDLVKYLGKLAARPGHQLITQSGGRWGSERRPRCTWCQSRRGRSAAITAAWQRINALPAP